MAVWTSEDMPLVLAPRTRIVQVEQLPPGYAQELGAQPGDYGIYRPQTRSSAKIISRDVARFLEEFANPSSITAALLRIARKTGGDPVSLLETAFPLINSMMKAGFLLTRDEAELEQAQPGGNLTRLGDFHVIRVVQAMEDVSVYCCRDAEGALVALKVGQPDSEHMARSLAHEAQVLQQLDGDHAPRFHDQGQIDGRAYLTMDWIYGVSLERAVDAIRKDTATPVWPRLLRLATDVARAYAQVHERLVTHGDVHLRNIMVSASDVRLIDFGLASISGHARSMHRGGVGYFYEPEYAEAQRLRKPSPAVTFAAEQYSVAVLLFRLLTGGWYLPFSLERDKAFEQIARDPPLTFEALGTIARPAVESILRRALSKHPEHRFASMRDLYEALSNELDDASPAKDCAALSASTPGTKSTVSAPCSVLSAFAHDRLQALLERGPDFPLTQSLSVSINMGLAGLAYGVYRGAVETGSSELLCLSDLLAERAARLQHNPDALWCESMGMTEALISSKSVFNAQPGVTYVRSLIAHARADQYALARGVEQFIAESEGVQTGNSDFTFGKAGTLIACSNLVAALQPDAPDTCRRLIAFADQVETSLLADIAGLARVSPRSTIADSELLSGLLGAAHGWAGLLCAVLRWRQCRQVPVPALVLECLDRLARCAVPLDRGLFWPQKLPASAPVLVGGWCNGAAGHAMLWMQASRTLQDSRWLELAEGAAWACWDAKDDGWDLCCGRAGRSYAVHEFARLSGEAAWRDRAISMAMGTIDLAGRFNAPYVGLYRGQIGAVLLALDVGRSTDNNMPLFGHEP